MPRRQHPSAAAAAAPAAASAESSTQPHTHTHTDTDPLPGSLVGAVYCCCSDGWLPEQSIEPRADAGAFSSRARCLGDCIAGRPASDLLMSSTAGPGRAGPGQVPAAGPRPMRGSVAPTRAVASSTNRTGRRRVSLTSLPRPARLSVTCEGVTSPV